MKAIGLRKIIILLASRTLYLAIKLFHLFIFSENVWFNENLWSPWICFHTFLFVFKTIISNHHNFDKKKKQKYPIFNGSNNNNKMHKHFCFKLAFLLFDQTTIRHIFFLINLVLIVCDDVTKNAFSCFINNTKYVIMHISKYKK